MASTNLNWVEFFLSMKLVCKYDEFITINSRTGRHPASYMRMMASNRIFSSLTEKRFVVLVLSTGCQVGTHSHWWFTNLRPHDLRRAWRHSPASWGSPLGPSSPTTTLSGHTEWVNPALIVLQPQPPGCCFCLSGDSRHKPSSDGTSDSEPG